MNCKQIREEIDTASRRNLRIGVKSHLSACPDCRRYSDETTSLLGLLGAQPRVEVPTDFEFRLRARMARAQAPAEKTSSGFPWKMRLEIFSLGPMVAATAAIVMVITASTFYFNRDNRTPESSGAVNAGIDGVTHRPGVAEPSPGIEALASGAPRATQVRFTGRSPKVAPTPAPFEIQAGSRAGIRTSPEEIADMDGSILLYNPETKSLLNDRSRFYGAEALSIGLSKPAGAALTF